MLKNRTMIIVITLLIVVILIGGSYAILQLVIDNTKSNRITAGELSLNIEEKNIIQLKNAYPLTDEEGNATTAYEFTLTNDGNIDSNYKITLVDILDIGDKTRMNDEYIKCHLQISGTKNQDTTINLAQLGRVLDSGKLEPDKSNTYILHLWMDYNAPNAAQGTIFKAKLNIEGEQAVK